MDPGIIGLLLVAVVVAGAAFFFRPRATLSLDELLARLSELEGNAALTAVQKRHEAEIVYRLFEDKTVSLLGAIEDVFPNGSVTMHTTSRDLPLVGVELNGVSGAHLRSLEKGRTFTLRAKLPGWKKFTAVADLPAGFHGAKAFCAGHWYPVKSTYRVRLPQAGKK